MAIPKQMRANLERAATMDRGSSFEIGPTRASQRTVRQTEKLCNDWRRQAGNPGRVVISWIGQSVKVEVI